MCFKLNLMLRYLLFTLAVIIIQNLPFQCLQLCFFLALLSFVLFVFFRGVGLTLQVCQLAIQFLANILQSFQVFMGTAHAIFSFTATLFVFRNASRFLDIHPQLFRFCLNQTRDHALFNNGVGTRAKTGAKKNIGNVFFATLGAIEVIARLAIASDLTAQANFVIGGVFAAQGAIGIIKNKIDAGFTDRLSLGGTVKDHVRHGIAAQVFGGTLPHHPTHRINGV